MIHLRRTYTTKEYQKFINDEKKAGQSIMTIDEKDKSYVYYYSLTKDDKVNLDGAIYIEITNKRRQLWISHIQKESEYYANS